MALMYKVKLMHMHKDCFVYVRHSERDRGIVGRDRFILERQRLNRGRTIHTHTCEEKPFTAHRPKLAPLRRRQRQHIAALKVPMLMAVRQRGCALSLSLLIDRSRTSAFLLSEPLHWGAVFSHCFVIIRVRHSFGHCSTEVQLH